VKKNKIIISISILGAIVVLMASSQLILISLQKIFGPGYISKSLSYLDPILTLSKPSTDPKLIQFDIKLPDKEWNEISAHYMKLMEKKINNDEYLAGNIWHKAKLVYRGHPYRIKLRPHGREPSGHLHRGMMSLEIKIRDNRNLFGGRKFNLIIYERIKYLFEPKKYLSEKLGITHIKSQVAKVKIGNLGYKVFFIENKFDNSYFEINGNSSLKVFKWAEFKSPILSTVRRPGISGKQKIKAAAYEQNKSMLAKFGESLDLVKTDVNQKQYYLTFFNKLNTCIIENDLDCVKSYFDVEYISSFLALKELLGFKWHGVMPDNFFVAWNQSNGKLYPIINRDYYTSVFETNTLPNYFYEFKEGAYHFNLILIKRLNSIPEINHLKIKKILAITGQKKEKEEYIKFRNQSRDRLTKLKYNRLGQVIQNFMHHKRDQIRGNVTQNWDKLHKYYRKRKNPQPNFQRKNHHPLITVKEFFRVKLIGNTIHILPGKYTITRNIIFPKKYSVEISGPTKIEISPKSSIVIQGNFKIFSPNSNRVQISSTSLTKPFGAFAINGAENCNIDGLDISGGSQAWITGSFYSGGLNIYNCKNVSVKNTTVSKNYADDGLNIKLCDHLQIRDSKFLNNFADQVDIDYCNGVVENSVFSDSGGDDNGDGIDVSGSEIILRNNHFSTFRDKAVSLGEKSKVILASNTFLKNKLAIAVKDLTDAIILENKFSGNQIDVIGYQKKEIFDGANIYIDKKISESISYAIDTRSNIFQKKYSQDLLTQTAKATRYTNLSNLFGKGYYVDTRDISHLARSSWLPNN
jgi:hypothetical protein